MNSNIGVSMVDDVLFIFSESSRLMRMAMDNFASIPREDDFHWLPHPEGRGQIICGAAAAKKIDLLAQKAAGQAGLTNRIELETIRRPLAKILVQRFQKERRLVDKKQIDRALSAAVKQARAEMSDRTHFVPCHLFSANDPPRIVMGPVTFHCRTSFRKLILERRNRSFVGPRCEQELNRRRLAAKSLRYYRNFSWVAEVSLQNFDRHTSNEIATYAVTSAVGFLHMILGYNRSDRMQVGGMAVRVDRRASLTISDAGYVEPSTSTAGFGHVEYQNGWSVGANADNFQSWLELCGVALEAAVNPDLTRDLSRRLLDAVQWFGEACRDKSNSTRTIKFMTAVERLLTTGDKDDISRMLSERAANFCFYPDGNRAEWRSKVREAYDFRSSLVHGALSPRDPRVGKGAQLAAEVSQALLLSMLDAIGDEGLRADKWSATKLAKWFADIEVFADRYERKLSRA